MSWLITLTNKIYTKHIHRNQLKLWMNLLNTASCWCTVYPLRLKLVQDIHEMFTYWKAYNREKRSKFLFWRTRFSIMLLGKGKIFKNLCPSFPTIPWTGNGILWRRASEVEQLALWTWKKSIISGISRV